MTLKLDEFRLESYKERTVLMMALMYYEKYRSEDIDLMKLNEALEALQVRISRTECQPGGCSICNPEGNPV